MRLVAFLVPWLSLVLLACAASAAVGWWATRRAARKARRSLDARAQEGDAVVLRGRLRVEGDGLDGDWGGPRKLAATSPVASRSRLWPRDARIVDRGERCAKLWLDAAEGAIRLDGALGVEIGARQRHGGYTSHDVAGKWFAAEHALFDGDEVMVAGVRSGAPLSGASSEGRYRDSATHPALGPLASGAVLLAAAAPRWTPALGQLVRLPAVVLVALLGATPSCLASMNYGETADECANTCLESGRCGVGLMSWQRFSESYDRALSGNVFTCVATSDEDCRRARVCQILGACSAHEGRCTALTDDDCRFTSGCVQWGQCGAKDGMCRVLHDAHCRALDPCSEHGHCSAVDGSCGAASDEDCAASYYCHSLGHCSVVGDSCKAARDEDCLATDACASLGQCSARDGDCKVATDADCRRTYGCKQSGRCSYVEGQGCVVRSDADCLASAACAKETRCRLGSSGSCESDGSCATSAACRVYGHCDGDAYCSAASDQDCAKSERCKTHNACNYVAGTCAESCAARDVCKEQGLCSERGGVECIAASDEDCRQADTCRKAGECSAVNGRCVARSHDDCKRSTACRWDGRCTHLGDACVADGDDCLNKRNCRNIGYCEAREGRCDSGRADEACAKTPMCTLLGRCSWQSHQCAPRSNDDCEQSEVCRRFGWCHKVDDGCFVGGAIARGG